MLILTSVLKLILVLIHVNQSNAGISDYLGSIRSYFGVEEKKDISLDGFQNKIPYEVSLQDNKFLEQAIKLTGVAISELDSCQHRVVLKLNADCQHMNDEMVSKMAVHLLNCQSSVEGRKLYPCTDQMPIKDCTKEMDGNAWNSYHLMTNRVRAVCFQVRQSQFRGLTEHTVNKLMDAAKNQLNTLDKLVGDQEHLQHIAENTLNTVGEGHKELAEQQKDLKKAQLFGQLQIEDNINRLAQEKILILESQKQLVDLTRNVQEKLDLAAQQIDTQSKETNTNHMDLLQDMIKIQERAHNIFQRLEDTSNMLQEQSELANKQYEATFKQLAEVNATVHSLVTLVDSTKLALEERLAWITTSLGGTDNALERLYLILWHVSYLLVAMLACAFIGAHTTTRLAVIVIIPANLLLNLYEYEHAADAFTLGVTLIAFITIQTSILTVTSIVRSEQAKQAIPWIKQKLSPRKNPSPTNSVHSTNSVRTTNSARTESELNNSDHSVEYSSSYRQRNRGDYVDYMTPTPPLSRNGFTKSRSRTPLFSNASFKGFCSANTRLGTPCKLSAMPGRDYCHRHQTGDSVMG